MTVEADGQYGERENERRAQGRNASDPDDRTDVDDDLNVPEGMDGDRTDGGLF